MPGRLQEMRSALNLGNGFFVDPISQAYEDAGIAFAKYLTERYYIANFNRKLDGY